MHGEGKMLSRMSLIFGRDIRHWRARALRMDEGDMSKSRMRLPVSEEVLQYGLS